MAGRVLVRDAQSLKRVVVPWPKGRAGTVAGWVGLVLAAAALADYALAVFPTHFSSMEWEFGTIGQVFAGLPLLSLALAAIWVSGATSGRRWLLLSVGVVLEIGALIVMILLAAFALDIPVALKTNPGPAQEPVAKLAVKTVFMGLLFGAFYVVAGVLAFRQARGTPRGEAGS